MKILIYILTTLTLIMPTVASAEIIDRIVAVVNDSIITESGLKAAIIAQTGGLKENKEPLAADVNTRSYVLDILIEQQLMKQSADKEGIDVSEAEIDRAVEDIKDRSGLTEESLLIELAKSGLTYSQYREQLKEDIRQSKFTRRKFRSGINITDNDLKEFYTQNISQFQKPPTYRISILTLNNKKNLKKIKNDIASGLDFSELIKKYSTTPGSDGDLGFFAINELEKSLQTVIREMTVGDVRGPVTTKNGIKIITVTDKKDGAPTPLEEVDKTVGEMLHKAIIEEKYKTWLNKMKETSHIEVRL